MRKGIRKGTHNRRRKEAAIHESRRNRHKGSGIVCGSHDRISELPNDILISIISRLTLREATATSVVSRRWRYLHTYVTRLSFPTFKPQVKSSTLFEFQRKRFQNHVNMMNRVLDLHRGGREVKEVTLCMYNMKGASIEKWIDFALTKEIEIIDIAMPFIPVFWPRCACRRYSFGLSKLMLTKPLQQLGAIKYLKQLSLEGVDVNEQELDILVSHFLALESLSIRNARRLKKVSIVGHPKLKHLEITCESLEIRNVINLVSLRTNYLLSECAIEMENIPKFSEFYSCEGTGPRSLQHVHLYFRIPSNIRDQLQLIYLSTHPHCFGAHHLLRVPRFVNVKNLELEVRSMWEPAFFHRFCNLVDACPSLEELKIKMLWSWPDAQSIEFEERKAPICFGYNKLSPKFKVFEMEGYAGSSSEFFLASYVVYCAKNLERVTVVACDASRRIRRRALARAQEDFRLIAPPSLELVFI